MRPLDPRLLRYARAARTHVVACVLLGLATAVLVVVQAGLLAHGIAAVVSTRSRHGLTGGLLVGLGAVVAGRAAVAWMQDAQSARAAARAKSQLRRRVLAHAAALGQVDPPGRAEVALLATRGMDALDGYFGRYLPQLVLAVMVPAAVIGRLAVVDLVATATIVLTLPLIPVFMILVGRATEAATAKRWRALERLSHHFLDVVSGLPTLKAFGRARAQADSVRRTTDRYRTATMSTLRVAFLSSFVLELIATLSVALVAVSIGLRLVDGGIGLRPALLVIILAPEAYLPLRRVGAEYHAAAEGLGAAERAFAFLERPVPRGGDRVDVPDVRDGGGIRLEGVSVAHAGRAGLAPDGASVWAACGALTAISGPSGVGKTSLLGVLVGTTDPASGSVTVVGGGREVALGDLERGAWRTQIAWVDQSPYLFAGTVADNVRLSRPDARDAEVRAAMDSAGLGAMRLDRQVGESGRELSSGERRRVAIARALLRQAPVVLLDEPTAGLDDVTERELLASVHSLAARAVVIMATHRPAALAAADVVVALTSQTPVPS